MAKEFLENQMDIETLYEERKNLNQKLMELDSEINNCKVTDILNEFQIGKFYEVQYNSCVRFYWYCNCELRTTLKSGGFFFLLHRQCLQSQATNARQCRGIRLHRGLFQALSSFSRTKQFYIFRSMNISVT